MHTQMPRLFLVLRRAEFKGAAPQPTACRHVSSTRVPPEWVDAFDRQELLVVQCATDAELRDLLKNRSGMVLIHLQGKDPGPADLFQRVRRSTSVPLILLLGSESPDLAAEARACGVSDYLREPIAID